MKTHVTKETCCPVCGHKFNRMSSPFGDKPPVPGDISVGIQCRNVLEVQGDHSLRQFGDMDILKLHPDTQKQLYDLIGAVARVDRK